MALCKSGKRIKLNPHKMTLFCKEQKTPSETYRTNFDYIFGKSKKKDKNTEDDKKN